MVVFGNTSGRGTDEGYELDSILRLKKNKMKALILERLIDE